MTTTQYYNGAEPIMLSTVSYSLVIQCYLVSIELTCVSLPTVLSNAISFLFFFHFLSFFFISLSSSLLRSCFFITLLQYTQRMMYSVFISQTLRALQPLEGAEGLYSYHRPQPWRQQTDSFFFLKFIMFCQRLWRFKWWTLKNK